MDTEMRNRLDLLAADQKRWEKEAAIGRAGTALAFVIALACLYVAAPGAASAFFVLAVISHVSASKDRLGAEIAFSRWQQAFYVERPMVEAIQHAGGPVEASEVRR